MQAIFVAIYIYIFILNTCVLDNLIKYSTIHCVSLEYSFYAFFFQKPLLSFLDCYSVEIHAENNWTHVASKLNNLHVCLVRVIRVHSFFVLHFFF